MDARSSSDGGPRGGPSNVDDRAKTTSSRREERSSHSSARPSPLFSRDPRVSPRQESTSGISPSASRQLVAGPGGRSVKSIVAWLEGPEGPNSPASPPTPSYKQDQKKSPTRVPAASSVRVPEPHQDRQGIPNSPDVEDYSLTYLKYQADLDAPLSRCLDGAPANLADVPLEEIFERAKERSMASERTIVSVNSATQGASSQSQATTAQASSSTTLSARTSQDAIANTTIAQTSSTNKQHRVPGAAENEAPGFIKRDPQEVKAY